MRAGDFADGLQAWLAGVDSAEAEAAGITLAETLLLHRLWLRSHLKKDG